MPPRTKTKNEGVKVEKPGSATGGNGKGTHQDKPLAEVVANRPVVYEHVKARVKFAKEKGGEGVLTVKMAKELLGWEDENQFKERMVKEGKAEYVIPEKEEKAKGERGGDEESNGDGATGESKKPKKEAKPKYVGPDFSEIYNFKDFYGVKVVCWNNAVWDGDGSEGNPFRLVKTNRPFDATWADGIGQDILNKKWRPNGESVIIGRTGIVLSAQHRLAGLVLACQRYHSKTVVNDEGKVTQQGEGDHWKGIWGATEPYIETVVVYGIPEDDETTQTLDNVKPRSLTDTIYTSSNFNDLSRDGRMVASKMLDQAVKVLWRRTHCGVTTDDNFSKRQTHAAELDLLYRHKGLEGMVRTLFNLDSEDKISLLKVSPGQCAGLGYLMGVSGSNPDTYYPDNREERFTNKDLMGKATQFWTDLAARTDGMQIIVDTLGNLIDLTTDEDGNLFGLGRRQPEKFAVLIDGWNNYVVGEEIDFGDMKEWYYKNPDTNDIDFIHWPTVGGIDLGDPLKYTKDDIDAAEKKRLDAEQKKAEREKDAELERASKGVDTEGNRIAMRPFVEAVKAKHVSHLLMFKREDDGFDIFSGDAIKAHPILGFDVEEHPDESMKGVDYINVPPETAVMAVQALVKKMPVLLVDQNGKTTEPAIQKPKKEEKTEKGGKEKGSTSNPATPGTIPTTPASPTTPIKSPATKPVPAGSKK